MVPRPDDIWGIGVDLVTLPRFSGFLERHEERLGEVFTEGELAHAARQPRREFYLATRWALKEAVLKALGVGWRHDVQWTDVEALGDLSSPHIRLHGAASRAAGRGGEWAVMASAGVAGDCVIAIATLVRGGPDRTEGARLEILPG
jgi:holo-[acyl-carrier protein] synthase